MVWVASRRRSQAGFTLLELLISIAIGSVITATLLFGVVELLKTNQRESARTETQREMQLALDFISNDLQEAVFVYDGSCLNGSGTVPPTGAGCPGVTNFIPASIASAPNIPVLAFWRLDPLPDWLKQRCTANAASFNPGAGAIPDAIRGVPCLSNRMYTLVVYYVNTDNPQNTWQGQARIHRYTLPQFSTTSQAANPPTPTAGWVDPTSTDNQFIGWPLKNRISTQASRPTGTGTVLTDFLDDPAGTAQACPQEPASKLPGYVRTPTNSSTSFYACVRGGGVAEGLPNQSVAVFLRGNAAGRGAIPPNNKVFFDMQTVTLTRSSLDKNPL